MAFEPFLWLSGAVGVVGVPLVALLCLKIKSSKKDPAIMGVAGVISPIHDPEKATRDDPSCESPFPPSPAAGQPAVPAHLRGSPPRFNGGIGGEPGRLNVSGGGLGPAHPQHARTPSRTGDRRLPEIPKSTGEDSTSDLYATVEDGDFESSEPDGPTRGHAHGTKREHPYAKVKKPKVEHPYATVKKNQESGPSASRIPEVGSSSSEDEDEDDDDDDGEEADDILGLEDPHLHPPLNRSSRSGSGHSSAHPHDDSHHSLGGSRQTTPLPTEPPTVPHTNNLQNPNAHFSGDSQDSSKGYTSITVREPAKSLKLVRPMDTTYATLSETSDETYAAIDDPHGHHSQTNSETYAVIDLPPEDSEVSFRPHPSSGYPPAGPSHASVPISRYSVAPNHTYSRIDRSRPRSAQAPRIVAEGSSAANPQPPPPLIPKRLSYNVEEMYAKVRKGISRNDDADLELPVGASAMGLGARPKKTPPRPSSVNQPETVPLRSTPQPEKEEDFSGYELIQEEDKPAKTDFEEGYETLPDLLNPPLVPPSNVAIPTHNGGYETVPNEMEAPYEVMPDYWRSNASVGYETVTGAGARLGSANKEPGYEVIKNREADYDSIEKSRKSQRDPGYESVSEKAPQAHRGVDEPPYAQLKNANGENASDSDFDYETIPQKYRPRQNSDNDPQYEVLSKKSSEAGYETVANVSSPTVPSHRATPSAVETASPTLIHMSVVSSSSLRSSTSKSNSRSPEIPPRRSSVVRIEHMEISDVDSVDLVSETPRLHRESLSNSSQTSSPRSHKHVFV